MANVVAFTRALGDVTRWRIVRLVMEEALCVCELADIMGMPQSSISSHVQILRKAGMLESEKREKWTYFRIDAPYVRMIRELEKFSENDGAEAWEADDRNARLRLAKRAESCCPGPEKLKPRKPRTNQRKS